MSEEGNDVYKKNLVNKFKVEDTRGVGIPYPARTAGRKLAEEMILEREKPLINEGITFNAAPKKEPDIGKAIKEVFDEMSNDDNLAAEIQEIVKDQVEVKSLGDLIKGVTNILKSVDSGDVKMSDGQKVGTVGEKKNVNMGQDANMGMTNDDSSTTTRLLDKNWSPLIVRKYQHKGWPLFISLICDANLDDLDATVMRIADEAEELGFKGNTIQSGRNFCGYMSDELVKHYNGIKKGCNEGVAVLWYIDKCFISSLYGDFMVHAPCKAELFAIINTLPHI